MVMLIIVAFFLAGLVKGTLGLGLPTVAMALLSLGIAPIQAASLLLLPTILTNIWQLMAEGQFMHLLKRFFVLLLALFFGTMFSIFPTLGSAHALVSEILLASLLVIYACYGLYAKQLPNLCRYEKILSPVVGYLSGALCVATGVVIIPIAPYLNTLNLKKTELIQSLGLVFTVANFGLLYYLAGNPEIHLSDHWLLSILALLVALLGMSGGKQLRHRISEQKFKRLFFYGLLALGSYMLIAALLWH